MSYDNTNSGFIGKNSRKTEEKHPDITGSVNVDGREYWISGWKNAKGYGLKIKPKDAAQQSQQSRSASAPQNDPFDDDLPPF